MTEKEIERNKRRKIGRILNWIGLGSLSLIIIAAAHFRAPWKVIVLLLIFLSACTVLPKPAIKWFLAGVAVVILALIIWVFLPEDNEGWRPYTFDNELAELEAKYAIPDSENAAVIYNQLLADEAKYKERQQEKGDKLVAELLEKGTVSIPVEDVNDTNNLFGFSYSTFYPDFWNSDIDYLTRTQTWSSKQYPRAAQWLRQRESTTNMLLEASRKQRCSFPIPPDAMSLRSSMERYGPMRRWAMLLVQASNNDLGDGRLGAALEKTLAVLQMANHLYQQPLLMDFLVAQAFEIHALENLKRAVIQEDFATQHLDLIRETLEGIERDWRSDFLRILECEKLMAKNMHAGLLFEINQDGDIRRTRCPKAITIWEDPNNISQTTFLQRKLGRARIILSCFFNPSTPDKLADILDNAYRPLSAMAEEDFDWQKKPQKISLSSIQVNYSFFVHLIMVVGQNSMYGFHEQYLRTATDRAGTILMVKLRGYKNKNGRWPTTLEDIRPLVPPEAFVDPANGGDFVYLVTADGFILYSRGQNNIDEHGEYDTTYDNETGQRRTLKDDWLIWPPKSRLRKDRMRLERPPT